VTTFEFFRFRFRFRALAPLAFPERKSANLIRGAFGAALRENAPAEVYESVFSPMGDPSHSPSGLSDWPRPFVLRVSHLDGAGFDSGEAFFVDMNVFELRAPILPHLEAAFAGFSWRRFAQVRGTTRLAELERVERLDPEGPRVIRLDPEPVPADCVGLRFVTPTELKAGGCVVERPEFPILFARLRDRLSTLRSLYGAGALDIDFRGMGERARGVRLCRADLVWEKTERRSGRTGIVHPMGGFTGEAEYEGELGEFLPWLHAARWVGVGRQTTWGKGEVHVLGQA
jgi:hypothetical protein